VWGKPRGGSSPLIRIKPLIGDPAAPVIGPWAEHGRKLSAPRGNTSARRGVCACEGHCPLAADVRATAPGVSRSRGSAVLCGSNTTRTAAAERLITAREVGELRKSDPGALPRSSSQLFRNRSVVSLRQLSQAGNTAIRRKAPGETLSSSQSSHQIRELRALISRRSR
jgi:hypothetical protein